MRLERRREPRYPFVATAEIVDERENVRTSSKVYDLSLHGCYVEMVNPFPQGTNVLMEIYTETEFLETHATVVFLEPREGMGVTFNDMPACFATVLNKWLQNASRPKAK